MWLFSNILFRLLDHNSQPDVLVHMGMTRFHLHKATFFKLLFDNFDHWNQIIILSIIFELHTMEEDITHLMWIWRKVWYFVCDVNYLPHNLCQEGRVFKTLHNGCQLINSHTAVKHNNRNATVLTTQLTPFNVVLLRVSVDLLLMTGAGGTASEIAWGI